MGSWLSWANIALYLREHASFLLRTYDSLECQGHRGHQRLGANREKQRHPNSSNTASTKILVSKYHSPLKQTRRLGEMADSSTWAGKIQNEPETSYTGKQG